MHAVRWLASPRQGKRYIREGNALLYDFWYFSSVKSAREEKFLYVSSRANNVRPYFTGRRGADPYKLKPKYSQQPKQKIYAYPLFLLHIQVQKKKLQKRKRREGIDTYAKHVCRRRRDGVISRSAEHDKGDLPLSQPPFEKGGRKLYSAGENFNWWVKILRCVQKNLLLARRFF